MVTTHQIRCIIVHVADETTNMNLPSPSNKHNNEFLRVNAPSSPRFRPSDLVPWSDPCIAGLIHKLQNEVRDDQEDAPHSADEHNASTGINRITSAKQPLRNYEQGKHLTDDRWLDRLLTDLDLDSAKPSGSNSAYWELDEELDFAFPSDEADDFDATQEEAYYADLLRADLEELDVDIFYDHQQWS